MNRSPLAAAILATFVVTAPVRAQELSAADRAAAAQAYDRASAAYLAGQYDRAASLFETAYRVLPNGTALMQAARAHERAGHAARSATLAARLEAQFSDAPEIAEARTLLEQMQAGLIRIELSADATYHCEINGALQDPEDSILFVQPGEHSVRVTFETGVVQETVTGVGGEVVRLELTAPPSPARTTEAALIESSGAVEPEEAGGGLPSWAFGVLMGATAISAGVLIAFGVDAWSGLDAYQTAPTRAGLEDGQARELRTNVMFGVTGGLAVGTLIVALLTDWRSDPGSDEPSVAVSLSGDGGFLALQGSLP